MKSKKAHEYLNRVYKPGNASMKSRMYNREMCNKAIDKACSECEDIAIDVLDSVLSFSKYYSAVNNCMFNLILNKIKDNQNGI